MTVTASMGLLGTDVVGVGADGRRWLMRCHHDPSRLEPADVHRFADMVRQARRGEVSMMVVPGTVPDPVLHTAAQAGVTLVDAGSLRWWAALQSENGSA
ncbi:hypothetical protein GCM10010172_29850 [Paractinoplanes ferrugineus]|uniref:Restriction endonuclease type IV Mrr domain-containing protein n=1 Tax=Paractinoplanes ferrugineus TaxID=113564 RepID=A0A919J8D0_9ACTN|nr:hypothetical protein Afe05nite_74900 [Actinoplanes ferrugineus]